MLRIELPFPPAELFPNRAAGMHWAKLRAAKDAARDGAFYLAKQAIGAFKPPAGDVPITLTFCAPDARRRDLDGALSAAKHQLDGVALALKLDDSRFDPVTLRRGERVKGGALIVEVAA